MTLPAPTPTRCRTRGPPPLSPMKIVPGRWGCLRAQRAEGAGLCFQALQGPPSPCLPSVVGQGGIGLPCL